MPEEEPAMPEEEAAGPAVAVQVVVDCADCDEPHYFTWGLLMSNLRGLLEENSAQVHEPAFDPDPAQYVTWDYARGFSDCWIRHHGGETSGLKD